MLCSKSVKLQNFKHQNLNDLSLKFEQTQNFVLDNEINDKLNLYKSYLFSNSEWNYIRKIINEYELLCFKKSNICKYKPLSRSFFKLWQMLYDYNIPQVDDLRICCLAEAPGGFIDAFNKYFTNYNFIYGISIINNSNEDIPTWNSANIKFQYNQNIYLLYKDLYKINQVYFLLDYIGEGTCDIVTADGGFDFSYNYTNQDQVFIRLFFSEITTALSLQKIGGTFICKIFDFNNLFTLKLIHILYSVYETVIITKPSISRDANSEKYIICKNFKGIPNKILKHFYKIIILWDNIDLSNYDIFDFKLDTNYIDTMLKYNKYFIYKQLNNYEYINYIYQNLNYNIFVDIIKNQILKTFEWCKKYDLKINYNNDFFKENIKVIYFKYYSDLNLLT
tara:strand:+ start:168 stop:1343 length:1176 start_codon:yes stop_codon:yes gene_type:complete